MLWREVLALYREKLHFPSVAWVQKHKESWQEEEAQQQTLPCGREISLISPNGSKEGSSSCVAHLILLESHCQALGAFYSCLIGDVV